MQRTDRREFLRNATMAAVAAAHYNATSPAAAAQESTMKIVDTHQHLWDLARLRLPWVQSAPEVLRRSYLPADYAAATQGLGVTKSVYMEVDVVPEQQAEEANYIVMLCRAGQHVTEGAVISGRPDSNGFAEYARAFAERDEVKGFRRVLHVDETPQGLCLSERFVASMRLLAELGKSFDLCMRPTELADAVKLANQSPETQFVLDHCGNADPKAFMSSSETEPWHTRDQWLRDISALAKCSNMSCKISGIVARAPEGWTADDLAPIINHCLDEFGPDRVVFGGDWPVCLLGSSYAGWVKALKELIAERPEAEQRKLLHDNAVRIYRL